MEKAIILLTSSYKENASANGICSVSIMQSLKRMGYEVFVVGIGQETEIIGNEYTIKYSEANNVRTKLSEYIRSVKRMIKPFYSKKLALEYTNTVCKIINDNSVEKVVSIYYPLEALVALKEIKLLHPNIECVSFELDSATDGIHSGGRGDLLFDKAYFHWMRRFYRKIDRIFIMESHRKHFEEHYSKWIDKTEFVDIPVFRRYESRANHQ